MAVHAMVYLYLTRNQGFCAWRVGQELRLADRLGPARETSRRATALRYPPPRPPLRPRGRFPPLTSLPRSTPPCRSRQGPSPPSHLFRHQWPVTSCSPGRRTSPSKPPALGNAGTPTASRTPTTITLPSTLATHLPYPDSFPCLILHRNSLCLPPLSNPDTTLIDKPSSHLT
jgi:hypothetical protein